jgi:Mannosyltransferase (PIG-V)
MIALFRKVPSWFGRDVLLPFAATRLALMLIAWLAFRLLPLPSAFPLSWEIGKNGAAQHTRSGAPQAHPFINMWSRWDAGWYLEIAKYGYHYEPGRPSSAAFFPLYPNAIRFFHALLLLPASDCSYLAAGIALSNISLLASLSYLHQLLSRDCDTPTVARTILIILLFPTSFFFSSAYSESLFLLLTVSSLYYVRTERWLTGCTLASLAALCRSQGIILLLPLLVEYFSQRQWNLRAVRRNILGLLLIPSAVLLFVCYLRWAFGSWSILFDAQRPWGRRLLAPWYSLRWVITHASSASSVDDGWLNLAFFVLLLTLTTLFSRRLRLSYAVYLWTAVAFFSCWGMLGSIPRLVLGIFPLFICLALYCQNSQMFRLACLLISAAASAIFFIMYSQWQWVA